MTALEPPSPGRSPLRVLWVIADGIAFTPEADLYTTAELMRAFDRGRVFQAVTSFSHVGLTGTRAWAQACDFSQDMLWGGSIRPADGHIRALDEFDVVFIRADAPVTEAFRHALVVLAYHEDQGDTLFVNGPASILSRGTKVLTHRLEPTDPGSMSVGSASALHEILSTRPGSAWVVKPLDRNSGKGVIRLTGSEPDLGPAEALIAELGFVQVQPYWEEIEEHGEVRHLVFDGELIASWRKVPAPGDFRSNRDCGATVDAVVDQCSVAACRRLVTRIERLDGGMRFYSVDLIGENLVEVNLENVGGLPDADQLFGVSHAEVIVERTRRIVERRRTAVAAR